MALQNIGAGNRDDAFYRYKMPKLITKVEGRGNGIKTNLVNMVDVAKALGRPPSYTTKFFGCELGAQSKFDEKSGTSIVNGSHDTGKLAALLEIFIKKYVQCYGCGNPETEVVISKSQLITLKCAACGFVSDVDMRDKLTTFILKNPPEQKKSGKDKKGLRKAEKERLKEGEAIDEEQSKAKKESKKKKGHDNPKSSKKKAAGSDEEEHSPAASQGDEEEVAVESEDGIQWQTDTSYAAAQQRIKEQLTEATSEMVMLEDQGHTEQEKVLKAKDEKVSKKSSGIKHSEPVKEDKILEKLSSFDNLLKDFKECLNDGYTPAQMASYLHDKSGSEQEKLNAYFATLFEGVSKGLAKEVAAKKQYLAKVAQGENSQKLLLEAIAAFCGSGDTSLCKEVALVLKVLYDTDILEEEEVLDWYDNAVVAGKDSMILKNAKPFVDWLRSAEAESEEG